MVTPDAPELVEAIEAKLPRLATMAELLAAFTYIPQQRWGPVSPHGVGTALGFFLGAWLMARRAEPRGIPRSEVYNAVTWGALGAIIGARGFYIIGHLSSYASVADMLKVWEGGLTMFGGFVGGLGSGSATSGARSSTSRRRWTPPLRVSSSA